MYAHTNCFAYTALKHRAKHAKLYTNGASELTIEAFTWMLSDFKASLFVASWVQQVAHLPQRKGTFMQVNQSFVCHLMSTTILKEEASSKLPQNCAHNANSPDHSRRK